MPLISKQWGISDILHQMAVDIMIKVGKNNKMNRLNNNNLTPSQMLQQQNKSAVYSSGKPGTQQRQKSQFQSTYIQISQCLKVRAAMIQPIIYQNLDKNASLQKYLTAANKYKIVTHCNEYSSIVSNLNTILGPSANLNNLTMSQQKFWHINETMERQLEQNLRELKTIDTIIDNVVNEQFDKCNQIDEIQQQIRIVLSKKDANNISKAQPYSKQKQQCLEYLNAKKQEKQRAKDQKLATVKKILKLLEQLKKHRENGLKMCVVDERDRKNEENMRMLLERVIGDFKQITKNEAHLNNYSTEMNELIAFVAQTQKRIQQYSRGLLELIQQQNSACIEYESIAKLKYETQYFEHTLLSMLGLQNIKNKSKKDFNNQMQGIISKLQIYLKQNKQKQKQGSKIQQGIQTTKKTINIFEHILDKIETQNSRKKQLLKDLQLLQVKHSQQQKSLSLILESDHELQKMKLKLNQLNKTLENKATEANVSAYKSVHEEITKQQAQIKAKSKQIDSYKQNLSQNAKQLYSETMGIQQEYEDILSEIAPSLWIKGSDFTKEQSIKSLNLYLSKTFKRLSIAD